MKEIKLTQGKVALVDDEDFERVNKYKWHIVKKGNGFTASRHWQKNNKRHVITMGKFIKGIKDNSFIQHINGNSLDYRKDNLRFYNHSQMLMNRNSTWGKSRFIGVGIGDKNRKRKWRVAIQVNKTRHTIGEYENDIDAAIAHDLAAIEIHKEFAALNFSYRFLKNREKEFYELNPDTKRRIEEIAQHKVGDNNLLMLLMLYLQKIIESFVSKKSVDIDEENV